MTNRKTISRSVSPRMAREFDWEPAKAESNLKEHGVSFDDATTVFRDTFQLPWQIQITPISENRFVDTSMCHRMELLVVSYTERKEAVRRPPIDMQIVEAETDCCAKYRMASCLAGYLGNLQKRDHYEKLASDEQSRIDALFAPFIRRKRVRNTT